MLRLWFIKPNAKPFSSFDRKLNQNRFTVTRSSSNTYHFTGNISIKTIMSSTATFVSLPVIRLIAMNLKLLAHVSSNSVSEKRKTPAFYRINSSTVIILFLMELTFKWPIITFLRFCKLWALTDPNALLHPFMLRKDFSWFFSLFEFLSLFKVSSYRSVNVDCRKTRT